MYKILEAVMGPKVIIGQRRSLRPIISRVLYAQGYMYFIPWQHKSMQLNHI